MITAEIYMEGYASSEVWFFFFKKDFRWTYIANNLNQRFFQLSTYKLTFQI